MSDLLNQALLAAQKASICILKYYAQRQQIDVQLKADTTPVTVADIAADRIIKQVLSTTYPVLSEESCDIDYAQRCQWQRYWLIDPIDGTKEFIDGTGEFCISIALIENYQAIFGLIYIPLSDNYYYANHGEQAYKCTSQGRTVIQVKQGVLKPVNVIMSRRHGRKRFLEYLTDDNYHIIEQGSAIKFGLLAEGKADFYPRFGPSSEWDTAAGQCIVEAAGGRVVDLQGNVLQYNTKSSLLNPEFMAIGDVRQPCFNLNSTIGPTTN